MSTGGHRTKWRRNIAENFNRLSRSHERYKQTDDRQTDGKREFTFAKNKQPVGSDAPMAPPSPSPDERKCSRCCSSAVS